MSESNSKMSANSSAGATSLSLIERLQRNEPPAWHDLVHLYSPLIIHWCRKAGLPSQDCADINQEVFRSVVANIQSFRKDRPSDTFRGWLRTITRHKILDHFRAAGRQPQGAGGTEAQFRLSQTEDDDDELERDEDDLKAEHELYRRAIEMIRADFHDQTWQAFWQVAIDGKSATEVAQTLSMRPGTVRVAKSRVLKRLREQLGDLPRSQ
ncbi:MAG: sigma-70 family RNA polymerase sigma factor [Pirellulales bacterium]|nr:sigma-70 family RNA polymerase sigma factor [Pirellulales bacterium]